MGLHLRCITTRVFLLVTEDQIQENTFTYCRSVRAVKAALLCVKRAVQNHDHHIANPRVVLVSDTPALTKEITPNLTEFADVS